MRREQLNAHIRQIAPAADIDQVGGKCEPELHIPIGIRRGIGELREVLAELRDVDHLFGFLFASLGLLFGGDHIG